MKLRLIILSHHSLSYPIYISNLIKFVYCLTTQNERNIIAISICKLFKLSSNCNVIILYTLALTTGGKQGDDIEFWLS